MIFVGVALTIHFYNETVEGYQHPGLENEVNAAQAWQDNCMGQCHYAQAVNPTPNTTIGGPRPSTPISDGIAENSYWMLNAISLVTIGATRLTTGLTNSTRATVIKRTYTYGDEVFEYTFDPKKRAVLGNLEDIAPVSSDNYNILRDVPDAIYENTSIQMDFLDDIVTSGVKPKLVSNPITPPHRIFQSLEIPYLERHFGVKWWAK